MNVSLSSKKADLRQKGAPIGLREEGGEVEEGETARGRHGLERCERRRDVGLRRKLVVVHAHDVALRADDVRLTPSEQPEEVLLDTDLLPHLVALSSTRIFIEL